MNTPQWHEGLITAALSKNFFNNKNLIVVPNCQWTGHECDLLVVTPSLKIIDVEVKISRSDFLADSVKYKWRKWDKILHENVSREWPIHVWKHYYCMPREIFSEDMLVKVHSPQSGFILIDNINNEIKFSMAKNASGNKGAKPISAKDAIDIGRLASIRMWRAIEALETSKKI